MTNIGCVSFSRSSQTERRRKRYSAQRTSSRSQRPSTVLSITYTDWSRTSLLHKLCSPCSHPPPSVPITNTNHDTFIPTSRPRTQTHTHTVTYTQTHAHKHAYTCTRAYVRNRTVSIQRMYEKLELRRWAFSGSAPSAHLHAARQARARLSNTLFCDCISLKKACKPRIRE